MAWPSKIYVATTALGVYYTEDFVDPSSQPTWTAVNDGLPTTDCVEFHLDPFHQADRQYVLLETDHTLYRRENGGAWTEILTPADVITLIGSGENARIHGMYPDHSIEGRLWASALVDNVLPYFAGAYAIYSNDYGDSWTLAPYVDLSGQIGGLYSLRAYGNNVWVQISNRMNNWTGSRLLSTDDLGVNWYDGLKSHYDSGAQINHLLPTLPYGRGIDEYSGLCKMPVGGPPTVLRVDIYPVRWDCMWFSPDDADHQRLLFGYKLYVTDDDWTTINSPSAITPSPYCIAPWAGADTDQMLVGMVIDHGNVKDHIVGALYGEADTTATGIAGTNCGSSPFTDSIPYTAGAVCTCGLQAVEPAIGSVYTYAVAMPGYDGDDRGMPIQGDRSAWEASNYPSRHSDDVDEVAGIHHTLGTGSEQAAPGDHTHALDDLSDVNAAAPDDGDALVWDDGAGEWVNGTPANVPDHDHAGVAGDGGTFDAANLTSGAAGDGQVLTADGGGGAAWENPNTTDADAIHDNVSGEIAAVTEKSSPVSADLLIIEDSAAGNAKKRVQVGNLVTAGQYRQFVYVVSGGDFTFVIDEDGQPVMALQTLE